MPINFGTHARVVELVDTADSKSVSSDTVWVRVPSWAPEIKSGGLQEMARGYWKTVDTADGWDTYHDTQVWVEVDENGKEHETSRTRRSYNSLYAKRPGESIEEANRRKYRGW